MTFSNLRGNKALCGRGRGRGRTESVTASTFSDALIDEIVADPRGVAEESGQYLPLAVLSQKSFRVLSPVLID